MKPTVQPPLQIRGLEYGGPRPLFCIPLVAGNLDELSAQAEVARGLKPELVEWRADFFQVPTASALVDAAHTLREILADQAIIFTLRIRGEGGVQEISQPARRCLIEAVLRSKTVDIV